MRKFKVCLAVLMIAIMMGGSAWAFNEVDHVKVAPNGKGDLLIFPYYFAYPGDYSTKLTVINTSSTQSVVAKVVYRSFNWSEEILDHFIFLSPNDVWTGNLVNVNGVARLQSNDDSILGKAPSGTALAADSDFGNITPVDQPLVTPVCASEDANTMGYVEVVEVASRLENKATTGYEPGQRVAKRHIYDWYYTYVTDITIQNGPYSPVNVLTGYQENTFGWGATLKQANVFADYFNFYKLNLSQKSYIGDLANNTVAEIEAAMGKLAISIPYIAKANGDSSVHIFNFPTKSSLKNPSSVCTYYRINPDSPYWLLVNSKCETYTRNIYDLLENTPTGTDDPFSPPKKPNQLTMCGEVEFNIQAASDPMYTEGWIRYTHGNSAAVKNGITRSGAPISYTGIPVLASVLYWSVERENPAEANVAYTDGAVTIARIPMHYYQYSE
jgi:hypothetical protein